MRIIRRGENCFTTVLRPLIVALNDDNNVTFREPPLIDCIANVGDVVGWVWCFECENSLRLSVCMENIIFRDGWVVCVCCAMFV